MKVKNPDGTERELPEVTHALAKQVMDEAIKFYRLQLKTAAGAEARTYLSQKRRLNEAAWDRWDIGWAPNSRHALKDALTAKGVSPDLMVASGLIAKFGVAYWSLTAIATALQIVTIWLVMKLAAKHFGGHAAPRAVPAE